MDLLQLKYFYESAASGSFSKTAQKYMVPLTSVSASIRRLEKELGCSLFDRFPNYIALNENGRELQKSLCIAFGELDAAIGKLSIKSDENTEIKVLVRGMRRKVTELVTKFKRIFPSCTFRISFDFHESDLEGYDIIIDEDSERYAEYRKIEMFSSKLRIKCAQNHPLLGRKILMKQLVDAPFLSMGKESNMHKVLLSTCERAGFTPEIQVFCNDLECYEKLIVGGVGIAIGIENTQTPGIAFLDVSDFDERYTVYCHFKPNVYDGILKKFVDFVSSAGNEGRF